MASTNEIVRSAIFPEDMEEELDQQESIKMDAQMNHETERRPPVQAEDEQFQEISPHPGCSLSHLSHLLATLTPSSTNSTIPSTPKFDDHYQKESPIRSGSYGRVYKCRHKYEESTTSSKYAVKEMDRKKLKPKDIESVKREVTILYELTQRPNAGVGNSVVSHVIQLIDFYVDTNSLFVVQVLAAGGDVFDRLTERQHYTERDARLLSQQLIEAIHAMHTYPSSPIVHRDLKPENLLLLDEVNDTHVLVADFGFARHVDADGYCHTRCGTPSYVSPELLLGRPYNGSVDVWGIGCIIYMLLAGYPPFQAPDHRALFRAIRAGDYIFHDEHWTNVSISAKQLITHLLTVNVEKRWTTEQALQCSWFTDFSDQQLEQRDLSRTLTEMKKFDPKNAWKRAVNALGFCSTAPFWQPDIISFTQQLELWDRQTASSFTSVDTTGASSVESRNTVPPQHRILFSDMYVLKRELRKGKSGTVWECHHISSGKTYAVKVIARTTSPVDDETVLNEVTMMQSQSGSKYVVELLDFYEEKDNFYLVMEYCVGGDLFDRVLRFTHYTESDAHDLTVELLKAVRSIHKAGIAHRDIKPQNVLLLSNDDNVLIRIADFGYARRVYTPESLTNRVGTPSYVAPEVLKNLPHDQRVDIWSLGVVVFVLLVGYPPFLEENQTVLFHKIRNGEWVFYEDDWKHISKEAKDFVQSLLVVDPNERWTIDECLRSPWIQQDPSQLSSVDLTDALLKLQSKKKSLRNLARAVMGFGDAIRLGSGCDQTT
jgi:calcium/calmodulin-dependent protein kinase I